MGVSYRAWEGVLCGLYRGLAFPYQTLGASGRRGLGAIGGMIYGVGTDLVAIGRMRAMHVRFGDRLAERILAPAELAEFAAATDKGRFLAKRFAAKEAFAKAAGTGMRAPIQWTAIGVAHDPLGRPQLTFSPAVQAWLERQGRLTAHLSLSDERDHAIAFVVLEAQ